MILFVVLESHHASTSIPTGSEYNYARSVNGGENGGSKKSMKAGSFRSVRSWTKQAVLRWQPP